MHASLTLDQVAANPRELTWRISLPTGEPAELRPITRADEATLTAFVDGLSDRTRRFYSITNSGAATAAEWCAAIARFDKLRLLVATNSATCGLVEFSMDFPSGDLERFARYGYALELDRDCRFGLCIADELQGRGLGHTLLPFVREVARRFGRSRIILWGGVRLENTRAVAYYRRAGFAAVGEFRNEDGANLDMVLHV